jgi:hypothetical protein
MTLSTVLVASDKLPPKGNNHKCQQCSEPAKAWRETDLGFTPMCFKPECWRAEQQVEELEMAFERYLIDLDHYSRIAELNERAQCKSKRKN